jgi:hypothetical protein
MGQAADDLIEGMACSDCGEFFVESHGYPVLCKKCYHADVPDARRAGLQLATNGLLCDGAKAGETSIATAAPRKEKSKPKPKPKQPTGPQKFWMVFNSSGKAPTKRHASLVKATAEAERIAASHPGSNCYVLEALGYVTTGPAKEGGEFEAVEKREF